MLKLPKQSINVSSVFGRFAISRSSKPICLFGYNWDINDKFPKKKTYESMLGADYIFLNYYSPNYEVVLLSGKVHPECNSELGLYLKKII